MRSRSTMSFHRSLRALALVVVALVSMSTARAQGGVPGYPDNFMAFDRREVAMLPPYCKHSEYFRQRVPGGDDPEPWGRWKATMGEPFFHIHHYCFGLMKTNRAMLLTRTQQFREFYLKDSIVEFTYVLERVPEDFVLVPEILTKRGENQVRLRRGSIGEMDFLRATELNPAYWPPFAQLSDYYKSQGDMAKARKALEDGLVKSPDAIGLKRRLADLASSPAKRSAAGAQPDATDCTTSASPDCAAMRADTGHGNKAP